MNYEEFIKYFGTQQKAAAIVAPIVGVFFVLLALPAAVASIWRMARKGFK